MRVGGVLAALGLAVLAGVGAAAPGGRALLVGVGDYPRLAERYGPADYEARVRLSGPPNDARLMARALEGALGFDRADIAVRTAPAETTRAELLAAMDALAGAARPDELVVLFLAGHGTQQPDLDGDERDGLDEVFLASDAAALDAEGGAIPGAIADDELAAFAARVAGRGARVWLIADSCHSGTLLRGSGSVRLRGLDPRELGVAPARTRGGDRERSALELPAHGVVATFAAGSHQRAPELELDGEQHGLFTHSLARELIRGGGAQSYDELLRRVTAVYAALPYDACRPTAQGDVLAAIGSGRGLDARFELRREGRRLVLDAGSLAGLEPGARLAVYAPGGRGDADALLARARVTRATPFEARCELEDGARLPRDSNTASFPAELVEHATPGRPLVVAGPELPELARALEASGGRVVRGEDARWTYAPGEPARLVPATPSAARAIELAPGELGPRLEALYRRGNLLALAASPGMAGLPAGLSVELLALEGDAERALRADAPVRPGAEAALVLANESATPWDLWVFAVDQLGAVEPLFPGPVDSPTLEAGASERVDGLVFHDATLGRDHVLALALPAGSASLRWLATGRPPRLRGEPSELERFFADLAGSAPGQMRGMSRSVRAGGGAALIEYAVEWGTPDFAHAWSAGEETGEVEPRVAGVLPGAAARRCAGDPPLWVLRGDAEWAAAVPDGAGGVLLALVTRAGALEARCDLDGDGAPEHVLVDADGRGLPCVRALGLDPGDEAALVERLRALLF